MACRMVRRKVPIMLLAGLCIWGVEEAVFGLMQVLGWRASGHALYALTGHFSNPGPYGGFIACEMAVAGAWLLRFRVKPGMTKVEPGMTKEESGKTRSFGRLRMTLDGMMRVLAWMTIGMGMLVLPASMSRAGWLALAVALAVEVVRRPSTKAFIQQHRWVISVITVGVAVFLAGAFLLKADSALGRFHIWRMECRAIAARPWTGAGPGMGPWAYGEAQEAFFRANLDRVSPAVLRVAGCPEYAFNEFLGIGVEYGVPALVLSVLLVIASVAVLHGAGSPFAAGLTAWAVFACASYPLQVKQLRIMGAILFFIAIFVGVQRFRTHRWSFAPAVTALLLAGWMGFAGQGRRMTAREDFRTVYAQGYALHRAGRYAESSDVLAQGALMSCDPMFEIIMGKNAEALGEYDKANALYEKAHYMVPSRLYPLVRLMRLQIRQGLDPDALVTAQEIMEMPVNERHAGMVRLREETKKSLDSLQIELQRTEILTSSE